MNTGCVPRPGVRQEAVLMSGIIELRCKEIDNDEMRGAESSCPGRSIHEARVLKFCT